jgi:uncharacterized 2Fe-2S/4Fe-4S cluster protein (DUF4445 family)
MPSDSEMKHEYRITFQPSGRSVHVLPGTKVIEAAVRAGLVLRSPCGGIGTCGKCKVRVVKGHCPPTEKCSRILLARELERGYRLACQMGVSSDCTVEVPDEALFETHARILTESTGAAGKPSAPAIRKRFVELPEPTLEDALSDIERLERECGPLAIPLEAQKGLPGQLRKEGFKGTVVLDGSRFIAFEPGNTEKDCYGVAIDLGTTTVVATLVNLLDGTELGVAADMNPQISHGDDVISRITLAREREGAVDELQSTVLDALNTLIAQLCSDARIDNRHIYDVTIAGNTTMQHLLCGISPAALGEVPFAPVYARGQHLTASDLGLNIHPRAGILVFPNIGGFVGGANGLQQTDRPSMLVDIGTNGEIVLAHNGTLMATSTAAGPAFEGARIVNGMRAANGAIEKITLDDDDLICNVIGGTRPAGICGTALIDAVALLLDLGMIDMTGRIVSQEEVPASVPEKLRARLHPNDNDVNVLLVEENASKTGSALYLYQRDVRELQLAAGAIRAGVSIMLRKAGVEPGDLDSVLLAGGFGNYIRRENACRIGLLPDIPTEKIRFVGNASSMGAKAALLSAAARTTAEEIARATQHIDLSLDPEFQMEFGMAMMFPDA